MNGDLIPTLLKDNQAIADLGSGLQAAPWWKQIGSGCTIDAFDLFNEIESEEAHISFFKRDVTKLVDEPLFKAKYDLIVADHIFEHVEDVNGMLKTLDWISKPGTIAHIGIPVANNFTDIFYRLIHRYQSGGHIQKFQYQDMIELMQSIGFELEKSEIWEDDWVWLEKCFSLEFNKVENVTQDEIQYLVDTFRKELTSDKGYLYGYEYVFRK